MAGGGFGRAIWLVWPPHETRWKGVGGGGSPPFLVCQLCSGLTLPLSHFCDLAVDLAVGWLSAGSRNRSVWIAPDVDVEVNRVVLQGFLKRLDCACDVCENGLEVCVCEGKSSCGGVPENHSPFCVFFDKSQPVNSSKVPISGRMQIRMASISGLWDR